MEEQELISRLREGDSEAINKIVEQYKGPLFAFILRMVNNHEAAEDLFQETWLRVIRSIRNFRGDSKLSTCVFSIALNLCRDTERKRKRWFHVSIDEYEESLSQEIGIDPVRILKAQQVRKIVAGLPVKMREVIVLRYYHDLSNQEISEIINCPVHTVKSRSYRALKIIRRKWKRLTREITGENGNYKTI